MDEFERIREALGAPEADDAAKARAWARIQREITMEQPSPTGAAPAPVSERGRRPPLRRRHAVLLGIAAAIALIAIVLQVVLPSGRGGPAVSAEAAPAPISRLIGPDQPNGPGTGYAD